MRIGRCPPRRLTGQEFDDGKSGAPDRSEVRTRMRQISLREFGDDRGVLAAVLGAEFPGAACGGVRGTVEGPS